MPRFRWQAQWLRTARCCLPKEASPGQGEGTRLALAGVSLPGKPPAAGEEACWPADTPASLSPWGQAARKALRCPNLAASPNET